MTANTPVGIAGAGSIGCFVGGMLAQAGRRVALLARPRVIEEIALHGIRVTSFDGMDRTLSPTELAVSADPAIFQDATVVLVTVKSADTAEIAELIARHAPADAVIVSLQNGVGNVAVLRERVGRRRVLGGMVPFNVLALGEGRFHRATSGDIVVERGEAGTAAQLSVPGLTMRPSGNIEGVQWGKLVVNLNNALNALSGLPLRAQLAQRPWRRLLADQIAEALVAIKAAGITPAASTPVPPSLTPHLLRLPDAVFRLLLGRTMKIDAEARSSMWEDLQRGRRTEIDYLQGVIVAMAQRHGLEARLSERVVSLIQRAEAEAKGSPGLTPDQIRTWG
jgi:2-dehydropantoate 2-reductase